MIELQSTLFKLLRHVDTIKQVTTHPRPIATTIAITSKCNASCDFCYSRHIHPGELTPAQIVHFVDVIKPKAVEITGGEPLVHPQINLILETLGSLGYPLGLITNGLLLSHLSDRAKDALTWVRISLNESFDHNKELVIPAFPRKVYVGAQYVIHDHGLPNLELRTKLNQFWDAHLYPHLQYIRLVEDITGTRVIDELYWSEYPVIHRIPRYPYFGVCYLGYLRPMVHPSGNVYPCTCHLGPETRSEDPTVRPITTIDHPEKLLTYEPYLAECQQCAWHDRNKFVSYLIADHVKHEEFI